MEPSPLLNVTISVILIIGQCSRVDGTKATFSAMLGGTMPKPGESVRFEYNVLDSVGG